MIPNRLFPGPETTKRMKGRPEGENGQETTKTTQNELSLSWPPTLFELSQFEREAVEKRTGPGKRKISIEMEEAKLF